MTTKFIGVKEFRQNIAKFAKSSKKNNQRIVILNRTTPILEVRPISDKDANLDNLMLKIQRGLDDAKAGRFYTHEQVEEMLGL